MIAFFQYQTDTTDSELKKPAITVNNDPVLGDDFTFSMAAAIDDDKPRCYSRHLYVKCNRKVSITLITVSLSIKDFFRIPKASQLTIDCISGSPDAVMGSEDIKKDAG